MKVSQSMSIEIPINFKAIDDRRQELGLTWKQLANKTGCTRQHLNSVSSGVARSTSLGLLLRLEEVLSIDLGSHRVINLMKGDLESMRRYLINE